MTYSQRGSLRDLAAFGKHLKERNRVFRHAPATPLPRGTMNVLANRLHPPSQRLRISAVRDEYPGTYSYRLEPADAGGRIAPFRAGQYIALETPVGENRVSRPYSITSSPDEARRENAYTITVKRMDGGYVSVDGIARWTVGTELLASEPEGFFYYEPLRDSEHLLCLAGGTGITPFRSIISDTLEHHPDTRIHLFYGVNSREELLFDGHFTKRAAAYPGRFFYRVVDDGFISAPLIADIVDGASVFICGPQAMHDHLTAELAQFALPRRRIRRENFGSPVAAGETKDTVFTIAVTRTPHGEPEKRIPASSSETVLVALERAGLNPPARCRSGECGWCRMKLYSGSVRIAEGNDGLRQGDRKFSYIHTCSSFPTSDLEIGYIPNPLKESSHEVGS